MEQIIIKGLKIGGLWWGIFFFTNCGNPKQSPSQSLLSFVKKDKNGLVQEVREGAITYQAHYLPIAQQALKEVGFTIRDTAAFQQKIKEMEGHHYLLLKIIPNEVGKSLATIYTSEKAEKSWKAVSFELNFKLQEQFVLWVGKQAKSCQLYHAFPSLKATDGLQFMLLFKDDKAALDEPFPTDITLEFRDAYFAKKKIALTFSKSDLNKIPKLKL